MYTASTDTTRNENALMPEHAELNLTFAENTQNKN
jgi:hypothetical protein